MSNTDTLQIFKYSDNEISSLIKNLSALNVESSYHLILLAGANKSAKKDFQKKVQKQSGNQLKNIDLRDIISTQLEESREKIDEMISSLGSEKYIWLQNGDQLGGVYTGYSYSVQRYATPQERYLLKKIAGSEKIYFLDLEDIHTVNNLMRRHAHTLVTFEYPESFLGRLKQITVHGHTFSSKRKALT